MSEACSPSTNDTARLGLADWLGLAAAPIFAAMALLTSVWGGGEMAAFCGTSPGPAFLGGMVPMYLLMSAFHAAPWLKLVSGRRRDARRT